MKTKKQILTITFLLFLSSCFTLSTIDYKKLQKSDKLTFDELKLDADYEFFDLRITLFRQFTTRSTDPMSPDYGKRDYKPNSDLGFDLGYGLFSDYNGNLSLKILDLFNIKETHNFVIEIYNNKNNLIKKYSKFGDSLFYEDNFIVKRTKKWLFYEKRGKIFFYDSRKFSVFQENNDFVLTKRGNREYKFLKKENKYYYEGFLGKKYYYYLKNNKIHFPGEYTIINNKNKLYVDMKNYDADDLTIQRTKNDIYCYNSEFSGLRISKVKDTIFLYENKKLTEKIVLSEHFSFY